MSSELPDGWEAGRLSDLVRLQRGHDLPDPKRRTGSVPVMGSAGISGYHDEFRVRGPGLVIGRSGASFGKVHYCEKDYWPLNTALFATDFLENEPRFVYYALLTVDFSSFNSGSAQPSLNRNFIASIPMSLPPLREQKRIVEVLGALDDKIDSNRRLAAQLEAIAATAFRARFMDFVGVETLADSSSVGVPTDGRVDTLSDLADVVKQSVQPSAAPRVRYEHFSIPAYDNGVRCEIEQGSQMLSGKTVLPESECVLLSKLNPATKRIWWPRPTGERIAVCSPEFVVLVPKPEVPNTYLYALLTNDEHFYRALLSHVQGTTGSRQRVKPSDVLACPVVIPTTAVPNDWDAFARPTYEYAACLLAESRHLESVRDVLLPRLISGAIHIADTADPAEVIQPIANTPAVAS
jgi:type I restriction enzyme S subunit